MISLGTIAATVPLLDKAITLVVISLIMTVGVYGFVAMIVKIDDLGLHLQQKSSSAAQNIGKALLAFAPILMKVLSIAGTLAMFLVGGGILAHGVGALHHGIEHLGDLSGAFSGLTTNLLNALVGLLAGLVVVAIMTVISKIRNKPAH